MDLDDIKAQLDRIFAARPAGASREEVSGLHEALIEFKVAIGQLRDGLTRTEGQVDIVRRAVEDYERRGRLAAGIQDSETAQIAEEYAEKAREKLAILERKATAQRDELMLAEREYDVTKQQFQSARYGVPGMGTSQPTPAINPETMEQAPAADPLEGYLFDQRAREAAVEAQLAHLKKKLGERG